MNSWGIVVFFTAMMMGRVCFPSVKTLDLAILCLLMTALPLWFYDLRVRRIFELSSTGLGKSGPQDKKRLVTKLIGLYGTFLIILILYFYNPVYYVTPRAAQFYNSFFVFLNIVAPWVIAGSFIYFREIDRRQKDPYDSYWHMGSWLLGRHKDVNKVYLWEHARVWFIKGFFIPFMFAVLVAYMDELFSFNWAGSAGSFVPMVGHVLNILFTIDIIYGVLGYILTVRLLDTHIQSTDPTWIGWLACLACYHPFYSIFGLGLFPYEDGFFWDQWLASCPPLFYLCGALIVFLTAVYAFATVAFGYRMSNLTYRGLITSGPYRWTKHPAYLGKVTSWWLLSLPFLSVDGTGAAVEHTINLLIITFIYYVRARTEENHLSNYPEYVQYANWINEHGVLSRLGKIFPVFRYSEEKCKRWNSVVWFKLLKPSK